MSATPQIIISYTLPYIATLHLFMFNSLVKTQWLNSSDLGTKITSLRVRKHHVLA